MKTLITTLIAGAIVALAMPAFGQYTPLSEEATGNVLTTRGGTVGFGSSGMTLTTGVSTVTEYVGSVRATTITLVGAPVVLSDTSANGAGTTIATFPEGRIAILGASINATVTNSPGFEASANDVFIVGIGSTSAAEDDSLATTEQDIIAATTIDTVSNTTLTNEWEVDMVGGADTVYDGSATAQALFFNAAAADTSLTATDITVNVTGYLNVFWIALGDD